MSSPKIARYILSKMIRFQDNSYMLGDFEEFYHQRRRSKGKLSADLWYWGQILKSLPKLLLGSILGGGAMFKHNLKFILRNLYRQKGYTAINLFGLSLGMMSVILIMLWVLDEVNYDNFHENEDSLYQVVRIDKTEDGDRYVTSTPNALGPELKTVSQIQESCRTLRYPGKVKLGESVFIERLVYFVDPSFFKMFTFPLAKGSYIDTLQGNNSILITEDIAHKYFGNDEALGKVILFNETNQFTVVGVLKNLPQNSTLKFDIVGGYEYLRNFEIPIDSWGSRYSFTYLQLNNQAEAGIAGEQIRSLVKDHIPETNIELTLQKFSKLHLYDIDNKGEGILSVYLFSGVAFLILIIACINFVNLTTARSIRRAKEVGVRKAIGAERVQLISQFIGESVLLSIIAYIIAMLGVEILLPDFNALIQKSLFVNYANPLSIVVLAGMALITGIVAGIYPALVLSSHKPVTVFRDMKNAFGTKSTLRKILIIIQYTVSVILIIGVFVINGQIDYLMNKDIGMDKENMLYFEINRNWQPQLNAFKTEILQNSNFSSVTYVSDLPFEVEPLTESVVWEGKNPEYAPMFTFGSIDYDFLSTFEIKLKSGRDLSKEFSSDSVGVLINEKAESTIAIENIAGKDIKVFDINAKVIGVVRDFNCRPLQEGLEPLVLMVMPPYYRFAVVKAIGEITSEKLTYVESVISKFASSEKPQINTVSDYYASLYKDEERMGSLVGVFALLAIVLSCLGLLGMSSFMAQQRIKEIGIRKALGAKVTGIIILLSKDFIKWIAISNIIAAPLAYYALTEWMNKFAFSSGLNLWYFVFAALFSFLITFFTVLFHTLKAARLNPVSTLKHE